jgi:hypothetical protein
MRNTLLLSVVFLQLSTLIHPQQAMQKHFDGQTWWEHVKFVADDRMEGRETGNPPGQTAFTSLSSLYRTK